MALEPLTKDSQEILKRIYKEYLEKINNGISKKDARNLGSGNDLYQRLFSEQYYEDYLDSLRELGKKNYLNNKWASNKVFRSFLTFEALEYCESKFKNDIKNFIDSAISLKNLFS